MTATIPTGLRVADRVRIAVCAQDALAGELSTSDLPAGDLEAARGLAPWRAAERLAGRALLRALLASEFDAAVARSPISCRPSGQPYLAGYPDIAVTVSHDSGYLAAGVALGTRIGIDVQAPVPATEGLIRRCCDQHGRRLLAAMPAPERDRELARIWTVQEACVKATGDGLAGRPWAIPVPVGDHEGRWGVHAWRTLPDECPFPVSVAYGGSLT